MAIRAESPRPGLPSTRATGATGSVKVQGPIDPKAPVTSTGGSKNKIPDDFAAGDSGVYGTRLDPMASVIVGGKTFKSGTEAANYLIQLKYSGNTSEYNRLVALLKAAGATGKIQDDWESTIAKAQRANVDVDIVLATDALNNPDVAASAQSLANIIRSVQRTATKYGINLSSQETKNLAAQAIKQGWDAATLNEEVARKGRITGTTGEAAKAIDDLREYANAYGITYNDDWYTSATKSILEGRESSETFQNIIRDTAKSRYGGFADQIDINRTTKQAASPYIQSMASILELDPDSVSLNDPTITKAITAVSEQGAPTVVPLWQFERDLKNDERYKYTKNAQRDYIDTGYETLRTLGFEA